jgi:hypothetical protein
MLKETAKSEFRGINTWLLLSTSCGRNQEVLSGPWRECDVSHDVPIACGTVKTSNYFAGLDRKRSRSIELMEAGEVTRGGQMSREQYRDLYSPRDNNIEGSTLRVRGKLFN